MNFFERHRYENAVYLAKDCNRRLGIDIEACLTEQADIAQLDRETLRKFYEVEDVEFQRSLNDTSSRLLDRSA